MAKLRLRQLSSKGGPAPAGEGFAAGAASPSAPVLGTRRSQPPRQRVLTRQQPEGDWNLPPPRDAELLPQDVAVRLRRPWRNAEHQPDLLVRQALCDQLDHLALTGRNAVWISDCQHVARLRRRCQPRYRPK